MTARKNDLIIVGGGIAGCAAAFRAVQYHLNVTWIRGDKETFKRSRGQWVAHVDNMIGVHEGIIRTKVLKLLKGDELAGARSKLEDAPHMHVGTRDIVGNTVERINSDYAEYVDIVEKAADSARRSDDGSFVVSAAGSEVQAPYLVLATGVMDRQPNIKKTKRDAIVDDPKWIYPFANRASVLYCIRCEGHTTAGTPTAVIGDQEAAAQLALMLQERYESACCVLTNGESPKWKDETQKLLDFYGLGVRRERIANVSGQKGKLHTIALEGGDQVDVQFALVALGLFRVYNDLARQLGATLTDPDQPDEIRHVQIDQRGETSVEGLFAVGDMTRGADFSVMKQVYTCQEYAVRAVDAIEGRSRRKKRAKRMQ